MRKSLYLVHKIGNYYLPQLSKTSRSKPSGKSFKDSSIACANLNSCTFLHRFSRAS